MAKYLVPRLELAVLGCPPRHEARSQQLIGSRRVIPHGDPHHRTESCDVVDDECASGESHHDVVRVLVLRDHGDRHPRRLCGGAPREHVPHPGVCRRQGARCFDKGTRDFAVDAHAGIVRAPQDSGVRPPRDAATLRIGGRTISDITRQTMQAYIDLIEGGSGTPDELEARLVRVLDRLAAAIHTTPPGEVISDIDAPRIDYKEARALVIHRFPNFGYYHPARLLEHEGGTGTLVGDAIDDLADIYTDLKAAAWTWDEVSAEDGRWELHFGFEGHWGWHLRDVQSYFQVRRNPR